MTVTRGSGDPDEPTRVDREPPSFPAVHEADDPAPMDAAGSAPAQRPDAEPDRPEFAASEASPAERQPAFGAMPADRVVVEPVGGRSQRWRWAVAAIATIAVVAVVGAIVLLGGARPASSSILPRYAPQGSVFYAEMRMDLPGDQRDRLISLMSHFPGFADPQAFQQKVNDTIEQVLRSTGADVDWQADVEPWFAGQVGIVVTSVPTGGEAEPGMVVAFALKDRAALESVIATRFGGVQTDSYRELPIWTFDTGGELARATLTDDALLLSPRIEDIHSAMDIAAGEVPSLASDAFFSEQMAALGADRLGALYFDGERIASTIRDASPLGVGVPEAVLAGAGVKVVAELRAETDHLLLRARSQLPQDGALPPLPVNRQTTLAAAMPADSIAYVEMRQLGVTVGFFIEQALEAIGQSGGGAFFDVRQIQQFLGVPPQDFFDFIEDAAFSVAPDGDRYTGGLIATVNDEAVAGARVERLLSTIRALAVFGGLGTIEDVTHGDAAVTVIELGGGVGGEEMSLAVSVHGGRLLLGLEGFVIAALDRTPETSLTSNSSFAAGLAAGGTENAGMTYIDVGALREIVEQQMPAEMRSTYQLEARPFVEPLSHLFAVNRTEGSISTVNVFLYVE